MPPATFLSPSTMPDVLVGGAPLTPQNLAPGPDRVAALHGAASFLRECLRPLTARPRIDSVAEARRHQMALPYGHLLALDLDGPVPDARVREGAEHTVSMDAPALAVAFTDGRARSMHRFTASTGEATPGLASLVSALVRGVADADVPALTERTGIDVASLLEELVAEGLVTRSERAPWTPLAISDGDALTWLGHATALVTRGGRGVLVDPFFRPHIAWTRDDLATAFSEDFADAVLHADYGPATQPLHPGALPPLDAVLITHQDIDHFHPASLMMLPEDVPIVVPHAPGGRPWEVDLAAALRTFFGASREVVVMRHGETRRFGEFTVTAMPFAHEMPRACPHEWNTWLVETPAVATALLADSAFTDAHHDLLAARLAGGDRPLHLCARPPHEGRVFAGWREDTDALDNFDRLWSWYLPPVRAFEPVPAAGPSWEALAHLAATVPAGSFLPYAVGNAPWFRLRGPSDPLALVAASLSREALAAIARGCEQAGWTAFPGRYAEPVALAR